MNLLDVNQAAEYLCKTPGALRQSVARRLIPHIKLGNTRNSRVLFEVGELDKWLAEHRVVDEGRRA